MFAPYAIAFVAFDLRGLLVDLARARGLPVAGVPHVTFVSDSHPWLTPILLG